MGDEFCLKMPNFHVTSRDLLHALNLRHGANGFTSHPKEGMLRIFFRPASAGFEPANLCTKGQHATSRPPKPLACQVTERCYICEICSLCKYENIRGSNVTGVYWQQSVITPLPSPLTVAMRRKA